MSHLPIWYLGQASIEDCDKAFAEYMLLPTRNATMGIKSDNVDHSQRNTTIRFSDKENWFGHMMYKYALLANVDCSWGWEVNDHEAVQFAEYGINQKYNWHVDNFPLSGAPTDRKITVICLMNDPSEFEGGELQIRLYGEFTPELKKGSLIAFPSVLEHRVTPVTKGVRYSSTMWLSGPRFR